jgi:hypothetical protein
MASEGGAHQRYEVATDDINSREGDGSVRVASRDLADLCLLAHHLHYSGRNDVRVIEVNGRLTISQTCYKDVCTNMFFQFATAHDVSLLVALVFDTQLTDVVSTPLLLPNHNNTAWLTSPQLTYKSGKQKHERNLFPCGCQLVFQWRTVVERLRCYLI